MSYLGCRDNGDVAVHMFIGAFSPACENPDSGRVSGPLSTAPRGRSRTPCGLDWDRKGGHPVDA